MAELTVDEVLKAHTKMLEALTHALVLVDEAESFAINFALDVQAFKRRYGLEES
jgi:hypothetical protein